MHIRMKNLLYSGCGGEYISYVWNIKRSLRVYSELICVSALTKISRSNGSLIPISALS